MNRRISNAKKGFALIEVIGVIAVMAILAGAMAPFLLQVLDRGEGDAEQAALEAIAEGIRQHYLDESSANYGTLPANFAAIVGYAGNSLNDLTTNGRGVGRLYASNGANLSQIPQVTVATHLLVGGAAPTAMACAGSAEIAVDPCGDSPGATTDDMPAGINTNLIKIVNLNLARERAEIIKRVQNRYLAPVVSAAEGLVNDVCSSIADGTYDIDNAALPAELANAAPLNADDLWGNKIQLTKTAERLVFWSSGPGGLPAVPANPLFMTAACSPGSELDELLARIADTVVGYAGTQNPIDLPATLAIAGLSATETQDPWGNGIVYTLSGGGFTLTSNGVDGAAGGGDDVALAVSYNELVGIFTVLGKSYVTVEPVSPVPANYADCAAVDGWMSGAGGCDTALGYLINASNCNTAIAYDSECTFAGY